MPEILQIQARRATGHALDWLQITKQGRVLSVFERACNFVNENGQLCAVVTPSAAVGPFAIELGQDINLLDYIDIQTKVVLQQERLTVGQLTINLTKVMLWETIPHWQDAATHLAHYLPIIDQLLERKAEYLQVSLGEFAELKAAVRYLAGRGIGLTPAGDDFLMGMIYALWITRPPAEAAAMAQFIYKEAAPRTTTLSGRWLQAAKSGEAHISWHNLTLALAQHNPAAVFEALQTILNIGHSSGADALSGFVQTARAILSNHSAAEFWQINN
ncbi:MAG: DUF2877 domain-containing protein [Anaerolineales bacterium]|nr:DUF2877 domain-containing protein [Anaerolineales bacterium]